MRRNALNFVIDVAALLALAGMIATGLVIRFVLPPGSGGRGGGPRQSLWGFGRHDWGDVDFWLAVAVGALIILHIAMHWAWVCTTVRRWVLGAERTAKAGAWTRNLYGAGFLAVLIVVFGGFLWIALANVETSPGGEAAGQHGVHGRAGGPADGGDGHAGLGRTGVEIRGSMTLADVESATGVPAAVIRSGLGLADSVPNNERLGRLCRHHGFEMAAVRRVVEAHDASAEDDSARNP